MKIVITCGEQVFAVYSNLCFKLYNAQTSYRHFLTEPLNPHLNVTPLFVFSDVFVSTEHDLDSSYICLANTNVSKFNGLY